MIQCNVLLLHDDDNSLSKYLRCAHLDGIALRADLTFRKFLAAEINSTFSSFAEETVNAQK